MAKKKPDPKKTQVKPLDDEALLEEVEAERKSKSKSKPDARSKTKVMPVKEAVEQPKTKLDVKSKTKVKSADDEEPAEEGEPTVKSKTKLEAKAKTKVQPVDADEPFEEPEETEVELDDAEAEAETELEIDAEPEIDADDGDVDKTDDDDKEPSVDEGPPAPPAKTPWMVIFLVLLNWVMAPIFLVVAYQDHAVRSQFAYRTLVNYVGVWGLPLRSEEDVSLASETRPNLKLTPDRLKRAFAARKGVTKAVVTDKEPFDTVDEPVPFVLRPSDMSETLLADIYWDLPGKKVPTLEDEIEQVRETVPGLIETAAKDVLKSAKDDDKKREIVQTTLLPLAWNVWQVDALDAELSQAKGAELDALVLDSVQRRIYYDILAPINIYRPGDLKEFSIEKIADRKVKLGTIKGYLSTRLNAAVASDYKLDVHIGEAYREDLESEKAMLRDAIEKRTNIAFILFTLSEVRKPTVDAKGGLSREKLITKGVERTQTVCGLHEFTNASIHYVRSLQTLEERRVEAVKVDRQGYLVKIKGKEDLIYTNGQVAEITAEIDRLVKIVEHIDTLEKRLADLKGQRVHAQTLYNLRAKHHQDTMDKLLKARKGTEKFAQELRDMQAELHQSLVDLSDAADRNFQLEATIRAIETRYMREQSKKGGKKRP